MIFVYFGRQYTVTARGMAWRKQTCEECGGTFHYPAVFEAEGSAESPYLLNNAGARATAKRRAAAAVAWAVATLPVAVPCRHCGWFQRAMVPTFRAMLWPELGRVGGPLAGVGLGLAVFALALTYSGDPAAGPTPAHYPWIIGLSGAAGVAGVGMLVARTLKQWNFDPNRDLPRRLRLRMAEVSCLTAEEFTAAQAGEDDRPTAGWGP